MPFVKGENINLSASYINHMHYQGSMAEWEITEHAKKPKLHSPIFIEGLPGIGNVGKIAVDFLAEDLKAVRLYSFFSHKFPHTVFITEKNLVEMPRLELHYKKGNGMKRDMLFLTGDIQPIDEESCYTFCEEVLKIVKEFHCTEIITTGGIGLQHIPEKPRVFCTGNDQKLYEEYTKGLPVEKSIFGVVGPIFGVSGTLLGLGKRRGVPGVALLAETFGHPMYLGVKGAQEILKVLETKLKPGINLKRMDKEIARLEQELRKRTKEWTSEFAAQAGARAKQLEAGYIG